MALATPAKPPDDRIRRNTPLIPDQTLPASGRRGRPPDSPVALGEPGKRWWKWLWQTPQATAFNKGNLWSLARRAQLEDEMDVQLADDGDPAMVAALADRRLKILAQMLNIDERFGLTPFGAAKLHWWIKEEPDKVHLAAISDFNAKQRAKDLGTRAVAGT
jgi:hypothetical protein